MLKAAADIALSRGGSQEVTNTVYGLGEMGWKWNELGEYRDIITNNILRVAADMKSQAIQFGHWA